MKYIITLVLIIIAVGAYLLWPTRYEPEGWDSFKGPVEEKVLIEKKEVVVEKEEKVLKPKNIKPKTEGFSKQDEAEYLTKIRDIIKDQWKELEDCESDFDEKFGALLALDRVDAVNYLKDPTNLDTFLEKLSTFKGTTPSSAKMLKELAMPITTQLDGEEILETVGFVKTCRDNSKRELIIIIGNFLNKSKKAKLAYLTALENEVSTLTYPRILYQYFYHLEAWLPELNIKESDIPEIKRLKDTYKKFIDLDLRTARVSSDFNPEVQRNAYEHALIIQRELQKTFKAVKKELLKK